MANASSVVHKRIPPSLPKVGLNKIQVNEKLLLHKTLQCGFTACGFDVDEVGAGC